MNLLERSLNLLGWKGGTVHQVNAVLTKVLKFKIDVNSLTESQFEILKEKYLIEVSVLNRENLERLDLFKELQKRAKVLS